MALPKHNPIVRFTYALSLIGMFGFIATIAMPNSSYLQAAEPNPKAPTDAPSVVQQPQRTIAGIRQPLDLDKDINGQLDQLWKNVAKVDLAGDLDAKAPLEIYAVYHNYQPENGQLQVTVGYPVEKPINEPGYVQTVTVKAGRYLQRDNRTVLDSWNQAEQIKQQLSFDTDYERYELDNNFNVKQQTAWLGVE